MALRDGGEIAALAWLLSGNLSAQAAQFSDAPRYLHLFTNDSGDGSVSSAVGSSMPGEVQQSTGGYQPQLVNRGISGASSSVDSGFGYINSVDPNAPTTFHNLEPFTFNGLPGGQVGAWALSALVAGFYRLLLTGPFSPALSVPAGGTVVIPRHTLRVSLD